MSRLHSLGMTIVLVMGFFPSFPAEAWQDPKITWEKLRSSMYKVQFPDNNFLNDYAGVLKPADVSNIKANLEKFNHQTGTELSVVTVKNVAQSRATNIDALALDFFSSWGIGRTVSNKGILVLISKEDHRAFIELGEGFPRELKAELNASVANFADPIKSERFAEGINQGISSLIGTIMRPVPLNER